MKKKGNAYKLPKVIRRLPKKKVSSKWGHIPKNQRFCKICKITKELEVHHIIFRKDGGTNRTRNLMVLCHKHHMNIHHPTKYKLIKKEYEEILMKKFPRRF